MMAMLIRFPTVSPTMEASSLLRPFLTPSSILPHLNPNPSLLPTLNPKQKRSRWRSQLKTPNPPLIDRQLPWICKHNRFHFLCLSVPEELTTNNAPESDPEPLFSRWTPPRPLWRGLSALVIAGQVVRRALDGHVHRRNTLQQLERVGPRSAGVCLLTAAFVGMAFTIQFVREFTCLDLHRSVGGVLALTLSRELSPVVTVVVIAGCVGSAFAAELGTMSVSEQIDTLRVLDAHPVDYLVTPRVIACCLVLPVPDRLLHGGLPIGSVIELIGKSGAGKTQLCLHLHAASSSSSASSTSSLPPALSSFKKPSDTRSEEQRIDDLVLPRHEVIRHLRILKQPQTIGDLVLPCHEVIRHIRILRQPSLA